MRIVLGFDFWKLNLLVQIWIFGFRTFNLAHLERGSLIGSAGFFGYVGFKILDLDFCLDNFMSFSNRNIACYVLYQFWNEHEHYWTKQPTTYIFVPTFNVYFGVVTLSMELILMLSVYLFCYKCVTTKEENYSKLRETWNLGPKYWLLSCSL